MDKVKTAKISFKTALVIIGTPIFLWCLVAIYFLPNFFPWLWLRILLITIMSLGIPTTLFFCKCNKYSLISSYSVCLLVILLFCCKKPSNDRNWAVSVAKLPYVSFKDNLVIVHNVRNFNYRTTEDFDIRYYDKIYDVNKLESLYLALSYWDGNKTVAHAIFSFGFSNGDFLAVSSEVRLTKGKEISLLGGIFNEYEIIYILADERDVLKLRTNYRKEEVFLYELQTKNGQVDIEKFFYYLMKKVDTFEDNPRFYNTLTTNCLTSLLHDFSVAVHRKLRFDIRLIKNGYFDELLYEEGAIKTWGLPFKKLKKERHINQYVEKNPTNYSKKIRTPPQGDKNDSGKLPNPSSKLLTD